MASRTVFARCKAHGAEVRTGFRVRRVVRGGLVLSDGPGAVVGDVVVNCAGLRADEVARAAGDDSFSIYPRKDARHCDCLTDRRYIGGCNWVGIPSRCSDC